MAQISLVKTLVLSYLELQRQIDTHHIDAPAYVLRDLRDQQAAILASLEAKAPVQLGDSGEVEERQPLEKEERLVDLLNGGMDEKEALARVELEWLVKSQEEEHGED